LLFWTEETDQHQNVTVEHPPHLYTFCPPGATWRHSTSQGLPGLCYSRAQTSPSHGEKWSGKPSWISWASAHICDSVTYIEIFKNILQQPTQKGMDTRKEMNEFYCC